MNNWYVLTHSEEIYGSPGALHIEECPYWTIVVSDAYERVAARVFKHRLCCNGPGFLASPIYRIFSWVMDLPDKKAKNAYEIQLTADQLEALGEIYSYIKMDEE